MHLDPGTRHPDGRGSVYLLLVAAVGFTATVRGSAAVNSLFVVASVGLLLIATLRLTSTIDDQAVRADRLISVIWIASFLTALSALLDVRLPRFGEGREVFWYWSAGIWIVVVTTAWLLSRRRPDRMSVIVWAVLLLVVIEVGLLLWLNKEPGIDVFHLHEAATDKLLGGSSPFHDLGVTDTSPITPPGSEIDGYPYPPATLIWFSLGSLAGDPRIASMIAWLLTLALIARPILKNPDGSKLMPGLLLILAAQPGWILIVDRTWTETLTLLLIVAAFAYWHRSPFVSGLLLGLAIVSKQYMIVLLPATLMLPDNTRPRRILGMAVGALTTTLPFAIADLPGLWQSTVLFHLSTEPRPDGSNLAGLMAQLDVSWVAPAWLVLILPAVAAMWIVRRTRRLSGLALAYAVGLSLFFLLASQAFANYWFLVQGLTVFVIALSVDESIESSGLVPPSRRKHLSASAEKRAST